MPAEKRAEDEPDIVVPVTRKPIEMPPPSRETDPMCRTCKHDPYPSYGTGVCTVCILGHEVGDYPNWKAKDPGYKEERGKDQLADQGGVVYKFKGERTESEVEPGKPAWRNHTITGSPVVGETVPEAKPTKRKKRAVRPRKKRTP